MPNAARRSVHGSQTARQNFVPGEMLFVMFHVVLVSVTVELETQVKRFVEVWI